MRGANVSSAIDQVQSINLLVINVTTPAILSAIALRSVLHRGDCPYLFVRNGTWNAEVLQKYLSRSERKSAYIGVNAIPELVQQLQSDDHRILAICDASNRNRWLAVLNGKFDSLLVMPQNKNELYAGPGQVLLTRFAEDFEREKAFIEFARLAVQVEAVEPSGRSGKERFIQKAVELSSGDTHADGRLTHLINQFASNGVPDNSIMQWIGGS